MKRPKPFIAAILVLGGLYIAFQLIGLLGMSGIFGSNDPYEQFEFPLSDSEEVWKDRIERQYQCELGYFGPDIDSREDTMIIVSFALKYNSRLYAQLDKDIETISEKIGDAYVEKTTKKRKQTHLLFIFDTRHWGEIATNVPQSRSCAYNLKTASVVPGMKRLIIPYYSFCYINDENQHLYVRRLGAHRKNDYYFRDFEKFGIEKSNSYSYKGLDSCETWETTIPQLIPLDNGHLQAHYQFIFHRGKVISVAISYQCYPENKKFTYADVVEKLRRKLRSRQEMKQDGIGTCSEYLNPNSLSYENYSYGIRVKASADTTSIPWTIRYETSLEELRFYSDSN
jgi:hypothetical protein